MRLVKWAAFWAGLGALAGFGGFLTLAQVQAFPVRHAVRIAVVGGSLFALLGAVLGGVAGAILNPASSDEFVAGDDTDNMPDR